MGKSYQGVLGNWSGRTGNVVGREMQGRTIYAVYQRNVHNPKTDAQVINRKKFKALGALASRCALFLKQMFANLDGYTFGNWFSSFMGFNFRHQNDDPSNPLFTVDDTDVEMHLESLQVSPMNMNLPNLKEVSAAADSGSINVTWGYTSDDDATGAKANDKVSALLVCETKRAVVSNVDATQRSIQNLVLTPPSDWTGEEVHLYIVTRSSDNTAYSNTWHKLVAL